MPRVAEAAVVKILFIIANMLMVCMFCLMGGIGDGCSLINGQMSGFGEEIL